MYPNEMEREMMEKRAYMEKTHLGGYPAPPIPQSLGSALSNYESLLGRLHACLQNAESLEAALLGARESDLGKMSGLHAQPNGHIERLEQQNAAFDQALCRLNNILERMSGAL